MGHTSRQHDWSEQADPQTDIQPQPEKTNRGERIWTVIAALAMLGLGAVIMIAAGNFGSAVDLGVMLLVIVFLFTSAIAATWMWLVESAPMKWLPVVVLTWVVFIVSLVIWIVRSV